MGMAALLRFSCRNPWRGLWLEWTAIGHLWIYASLVCTAFSGNFTGLFPACQYYRYVRLLVYRALDFKCNILLFAFTTCHNSGNLLRKDTEPSFGGEKLFPLRLFGSFGNRCTFSNAGNFYIEPKLVTKPKTNKKALKIKAFYMYQERDLNPHVLMDTRF